MHLVPRENLPEPNSQGEFARAEFSPLSLSLSRAKTLAKLFASCAFLVPSPLSLSLSLFFSLSPSCVPSVPPRRERRASETYSLFHVRNEFAGEIAIKLSPNWKYRRILLLPLRH